MTTRPDPIKGYRCNRCAQVSVNPADLADQYCGHCHAQTRGDIVVANWTDPWDEGQPPVLRVPRLGCSVVTHAALGWCGGCRKISMVAEALGWRYHASRAMIPGHNGALIMTAHLADGNPVPAGSGR